MGKYKCILYSLRLMYLYYNKNWKLNFKSVYIKWMLLGNCFVDLSKSNDSVEYFCFRDKCDFLSKFIKIEFCVKIKRNYYYLW